HVGPRRQDAQGRHGSDGSGAAQGCRRSAGTGGRRRQGSRSARRNRHHQGQGGRGDDFLMAAAPARFNFDLDLGRRTEQQPAEAERLTAGLLKEGREDAYAAGSAAGLVEGEQGATASSAKAIAAAATGLSDRVAAMAASIDDNKKAVLADAVQLAAVIAR